MLSETYPVEALKNSLVPRTSWRPVPTAADRGFWNVLPPGMRQGCSEHAEKRLGQTWPPLPATLFLEFARNGNRTRYERESFARRDALCELVLAECMEGNNRFVDDIVNGIWAICEETFWGIPAHVSAQEAGVGLPDIEEPVVPLFVGETAGLLAWTLYLLGPQLDAVSPLIRTRLHLEMDRRVLTPCLERDDFGWMGFPRRRVNNWNPWLNSNWLTATLLMERDEERRLAAVAKIMRSLDNFIDHYPADGGCDEGPSYWGRAGASLFDCLELLHSATEGVVDVYDKPLIQNIGRYIYKAQISGRYFVNFADAPARLIPAASIIFRYGARIDDPRMMAMGAWAAREQGIAKREVPRAGRIGSLGRELAALPSLGELLTTEAAAPLPRDVWLPDIQVMTARDVEGSAAGLFLAAKGGHNAESHNHNDVGNFIVYADGKPLIIDVGVETYTRRTFSPERYDIWTMQSAFHNLPTVNGVMQREGRDFAAREVEHTADERTARVVLDIAAAYPPEAGIEAWKRSLKLKRGECVEITDEYALTQTAEGVELSLLTPCEVRMGDPGTVLLEEVDLDAERTSASGVIDYEADRLSVAVEKIPIVDDKLRVVWGDCIHRLVFQVETPTQSGSLTLRIRDHVQNHRAV
ncbi:MAG: heparinase II/III-family protein [Kiritimatiellales bacterium]|nr:heparinase II/III-family protein [Kiritimatiellales bacterium]